MLFIIMCNMNKIKNVYDIFKIIYNNLNDVINVVNHIKCKLKHDVIKCKKLKN